MTVESEIRAIQKRLSELSSVEVPRAYASATNKVMSKIKTQIVKTAASELKIASKLIRKRVFVRRATARKLRGVITVYRSDIPGIEVGVASSPLARRSNRLGRRSSSRIKVGNKSFEPAFINKVRKNSSWQVLYRTTEKRFPIKVAKVELSKTVDRHALPIAQRFVGAELQKLILTDLKFRVNKRVT